MPRLALKRDRPAMLLDDPAGNGQSQAGSTGIAAARRVGAVKPLEDMRHIVRRDAHTGIAHQEFNADVIMAQSNRDLPGGGRILERIVKENQQQLCEADFVTTHQDGFKRIEDERLTASKLMGRTKGIEYRIDSR
jgi:hypothetical protein